MFRDVHNVEKNMRCYEKKAPFFFKVSLICHAKSMQNRAKNAYNDYLHKNRRENTSGTRFGSEKSIIDGFSEPLWCPGELQKGRGTLAKTTLWRDLVLFCNLECNSWLLAPFWMSSGIILTPFWHTKSRLPAVQLAPELESYSTSNSWYFVDTCTLSHNTIGKFHYHFSSVAQFKPSEQTESSTVRYTAAPSMGGAHFVTAVIGTGFIWKLQSARAKQSKTD